MLQKEILDNIIEIRKYEEESRAMIMDALGGMHDYWQAKRDEEIENEIDDMRYEEAKDN